MEQQTTTTQETLTAMSDSTLRFIEDLQQRALTANKSAAALVTERTRALPGWWPTPDTAPARATLERALEFRTKLFEANQRFALDVLAAWAPKPATK